MNNRKWGRVGKKEGWLVACFYAVNGEAGLIKHTDVVDDPNLTEKQRNVFHAYRVDVLLVMVPEPADVDTGSPTLAT